MVKQYPTVPLLDTSIVRWRICPLLEKNQTKKSENIRSKNCAHAPVAKKLMVAATPVAHVLTRALLENPKELPRKL